MEVVNLEHGLGDILKTMEGQEKEENIRVWFLLGTNNYKSFRIVNLSTIVPNYSSQCLPNH